MSLNFDNRLYSLESIDTLFDKYAMVVESANVVSYYYAKQIFTNKYFNKLSAGRDYNTYGSFGENGSYVTRTGFRKLATYYNFDVLQSLVESEK